MHASFPRWGSTCSFPARWATTRERLRAALREALSRSDVVITTGGLFHGDDLTKETIAEAAGVEPFCMRRAASASRLF
ncbi:MAG: molybdopterin-binding protein [Anaeromassilibacillus sp.]